MSQFIIFPDKADYTSKFESVSGIDFGGKFCINFLIQLEVGCEVDIDNVRIVTKDASGKYKDLKGNVIDVPLSTGSASGGSATGSAGTSDILNFNWGKKNNSQTDSNANQTQTDKNTKDSSSSAVTIIIIVAACVAVIAAGTVGFLVLRKKRKSKSV